MNLLQFTRFAKKLHRLVSNYIYNVLHDACDIHYVFLCDLIFCLIHYIQTTENTLAN